MITTKVAFLEGRFLSSQSKQSEKFSKSPDWLEKSRPSKKPLLFWSKAGPPKSHFCFDHETGYKCICLWLDASSEPKRVFMYEKW